MTDFTPEQIEDIAAACHEANRAYCQSIGDDTQKPWGSSPKWQRESAIHGVEALIADPNMTPLNSHQNWMQEKLEAGWKHGDVKDAKKKTHPCLLPFDELPEEQRRKDEIFQATASELLWPAKEKNDMQEAAELAGDANPTIRDLCRGLSRRINDVMAATGKRPGNLAAMQSELNTMSANEHPLMDFTD